MGKGSRLADRSHYGDGTRIIRSRVGARAAPSPIAEAITGGWRCANRDGAATCFPGARGTYLAPCSGVHRQVILGAEFRRVSRVLGWGDAMGDGPAVTPATKVVANTCVTGLRRSGRYGMSRTQRPGKCFG